MKFYATWFKVPHCTATICVRRRLRLYIHHLDGQYMYTVFMVGSDRERGRNAKCAANEDETWLHVYDHGNIPYQAVGVMTAVRFGFFLVRARTHMDPNKWVIFAYVSKPSESNNQGQHLASVPVAPYHGEAKALEIPLGELELNNCSAWSSVQKDKPTCQIV